ncbi:MAG: polymer-forming cytoskeletal protein [Candidatus Aminicenantes bacterium]|nr:polymer-forming cytoskeletal protein [Candidatus Aminicenantes bacterium]
MLKREKESSPEKRRIEDQVGSEESILATDTTFKGTINGIPSLRIGGSFEGDITIGRLVWVEKTGKIKGKVKAKMIIIEGELEGDIVSAEHVELRNSGKITGNINTEKLAMAEGSYFEGNIHMPEGKSKPITFVEKRTNEGETPPSTEEKA